MAERGSISKCLRTVLYSEIQMFLCDAVARTERKYSMLLNDVGGRHGERMHMSTVPSDVHVREVLNRSLAHSSAPSPVPSMFEPIQRPPTVMNYNFGKLLPDMLL